MIEITDGNLLRADAEALVNTVNCVGLMGKGIALQFKQAHPDNFSVYARACKAGQVQPGRVLVFPTGQMMNPKFIINFPTKRHWKGKSRLEDIDSGLAALVGEVRRLEIKSIAVPPLGCGNGGLDWAQVRPRIEAAFSGLPDVHVYLYQPHGAPAAKAMPVATRRPVMTPARALFIKLIDRYASLDYRRTLLEIQKLAYFMQEAGEPLRLKYEAGHYGPYAANLNKVLERLEGHFIRGYGDSQKPDAEIELLPGAVDEADAFLSGNAGALEHLEHVSRLIEGFETPYGMELLSSVHWVATHSAPPAFNAEGAATRVHAWNDRKRGMFQTRHIHVAWHRLQEQGWLRAAPSSASRQEPVGLV